MEISNSALAKWGALLMAAAIWWLVKSLFWTLVMYGIFAGIAAGFFMYLSVLENRDWKFWRYYRW